MTPNTMLFKIIATLLGAAAIVMLSLAMNSPVHAATTSSAASTVTAETLAVSTHAAFTHHRHLAPARDRALAWERTQGGKPYCYGGTGPTCYDCSGLVMEAYRHAGIRLPRTTYEMLHSWHLVPVSHPKRGDLAFYGSGHVELFIRGNWRYGVTYGAHDGGTVVGRIHYSRRWGWAPTAFYRARK